MNKLTEEQFLKLLNTLTWTGSDTLQSEDGKWMIRRSYHDIEVYLALRKVASFDVSKQVESGWLFKKTTGEFDYNHPIAEAFYNKLGEAEAKRANDLKAQVDKELAAL